MNRTQRNGALFVLQKGEQLLTQLNQEGTTVLMVTHSERDAGYAQRIINLLDGQVIRSSYT